MMSSSIDQENIAPAANTENIPASTHRKRKSTDTDATPKKRTKTAKTVSPAIPTSTMTSAQRTKKLQALVKKCVSAIKKTGHHPHGKPYTEVVEGMTYADALALLGTSGTIKTDNARWHRRIYTPREIVDTFGMPKLVHPIRYTGKVLCFRGDVPYIYAYAGYESLEVSMEKKSLLLKLKFRTFYRGAGRPDYIAPHMTKMEAYIDDDDDRGNIDRIVHGL